MVPVLTIRDHDDVHIIGAALEMFGDAVLTAIEQSDTLNSADLLHAVQTTDRVCALMAALRLECAMHNTSHTLPTMAATTVSLTKEK